MEKPLKYRKGDKFYNESNTITIVIKKAIEDGYKIRVTYENGKTEDTEVSDECFIGPPWIQDTKLGRALK